jgi:dTDP-4-dehydrorhamnose 3,5-epimerase
MKFVPLPLNGAFLIELEAVADERGFFARTFCREEFSLHGLNPDLLQCNISFNSHKNTLRGMHYQTEPHQEAKMVRCTMGDIYDVIIDLRPESDTFKQWFGAELTAGNRKSIYIPKGFAHGFLTLADKCEVFYQMSENFHPESVAGVRWDDPAFSIQWPRDPCIISDRDRNYPNYST